MPILDGKVILITGGAGGIGAATCKVLADAGARLVISDIAEVAAKGVTDSICARGGEAIFIAADLSSEDAIQGLIDQSVAHYGRLDGAFNNAGMEQHNVPLDRLTLSQWNGVMQIDLTAVFLCIKYQVRAMLESSGGAIVNTASSLGQVAMSNAAEYVAAKHGVIGLTRAAAADYGAKGIRVNAILPGIVRTPMIDRLIKEPHFNEQIERMRMRHLMQRFAEPSEIGEAAKWLLSNEASFVNGVALPVDGGALAN
ncbi:SDR family oxidoreductase [Novosphingobium sp. PASSN1]|uniref:SDR family NAD(P)-dependent oxidoreductase n=1 Tax=Novosphingobium sp. PASSN1 TaxID=2015561 RepID=UPI000BC7CBD7|nr:SDR family oxidoreductase [Novosphingobium sp. PASSN1]OYU34453.1 MAG: oxidoreductase [Novosphingobium sp. PASSN1]